MKKVVSFVLALIFVFSVISGTAFADDNMGGTGGELGAATNNFYYNPGYCGVRITLGYVFGTYNTFAQAAAPRDFVQNNRCISGAGVL